MYSDIYVTLSYILWIVVKQNITHKERKKKTSKYHNCPSIQSSGLLSIQINNIHSNIALITFLFCYVCSIESVRARAAIRKGRCAPQSRQNAKRRREVARERRARLCSRNQTNTIKTKQKKNYMNCCCPTLKWFFVSRSSPSHLF